ncbi:MAG: flagellar M-ring protein FliF [Deltaproteobacteria bacterium]|nr:flagellar M-ring protein FliF [Deltaproteobacteria bacterium]
MANVVEKFMNLGTGKKATYLVLLAAAIGAAVVLFQWAGAPEYQTLYSNLSEEDAASIVEKLKENRIPYRIEGGGVLQVLAEKLYETRLTLAGAGLPKGGGVGLEVFDKSSFGMTEFAQKVNFVRGIQGELARTIGWLPEVETARVHIVVPEKRLFLEAEDKARASVVLKLKPGRKISSGQVQGIVHMVASSVNGLRPENVSVIDTTGAVFTRTGEAGSAAAATTAQLDYQKSLEKDIEARVQGILEPVVGAGKVIARVSAEVDFKQVEKTEERFDPESVVVRSEQRNKEKITGNGGGGFASGGVPGVASNTPAGGQRPAQVLQAPAVSGAESQRQNEVINYEINKVVSRTVEPSGAVKRLSVAVLVDGSYAVTSAAGGKEEKKYVQRGPEDMKKFEGLVRGAVGFSAERGDKVDVINISFESPSAGTEEVAAPAGMVEKIKERLPSYLPVAMRYSTILVLAVFTFLFVLRPLISGIFKGGASQASTEPYALPEATMKALEAGLGRGASTADMRQKVMELAKQNPQQAAQIIKAWVKEK